jgi:hypothetical protein
LAEVAKMAMDPMVRTHDTLDLKLYWMLRWNFFFSLYKKIQKRI